MGLIARALEKEGIRTTLTSWNAGIIRGIKPPRGTITALQRGMTLGHPHDEAQQKRVLMETLKLLELDAPVELVRLNEK